MSDFTKGDRMIEELAYAAKMRPRTEQEFLEDPSAFFRGALVAIAVGLPAWGGLIWAVAKLA
jgi:hypothetical protein